MSAMAAPDKRRRELAQIHIAKAQLGLDEETYRAMLRTIGRVNSAADLGDQGRKAVLDHLKSRGFVAKQSTKKGAPDTRSTWAWVNNAAADRQPLLRKAAMILKEAGREKAYVDGIAKQMFGVERIEFCASNQLHRIVSALVYDQRRRAAKASAP